MTRHTQVDEASGASEAIAARIGLALPRSSGNQHRKSIAYSKNETGAFHNALVCNARENPYVSNNIRVHLDELLWYKMNGRNRDQLLKAFTDNVFKYAKLIA